MSGSVEIGKVLSKLGMRLAAGEITLEEYRALKAELVADLTPGADSGRVGGAPGSTLFVGLAEGAMLSGRLELPLLRGYLISPWVARVPVIGFGEGWMPPGAVAVAARAEL